MGEQGKQLATRSVAPSRAPSWPVVVKTTIRLWLQRRLATTGRRGLAALAVVTIGMAVAAGAIVMRGASAGQGGTLRRDVDHHAARSAPAGTAVVTAALVRAQVAGWVAQQVSPAAIVACDPEMCSVLQANGVPAARLLVLPLSATDPLGADVVVATPAVRAQFGARLASVYAPQLIASFGSGAGEVDVRAVAPDGTTAFDSGLTADQNARISAGQQLLRNKHIKVSAAARADLTAGDVDPRLLVALAALAAQHRVNIASFGDPSPGAPDAPLRATEIGTASRNTLRPMLSFLRAQRSPYLPAQAAVVPAGRGQYLLSVQYDAPSPLGFANGP